MVWNRRELLGAGAASAAAFLAGVEGARDRRLVSPAWAEVPDAPYLPFDPIAGADLLKMTPKAFAVWNYYRPTFDNRPVLQRDKAGVYLEYYTANLLYKDRNGLNGDGAAGVKWGPPLRDRPVPAATDSFAYFQDSMQGEIRLATALGLDAFFVNVGSGCLDPSAYPNGIDIELYPSPNPDLDFFPLLRASEDLATPDQPVTKIVPLIDCVRCVNAGGAGEAAVVDFIRTKVVGRSGVFRYQNRIVLAAFWPERIDKGWGVDAWRRILQSLSNAGIPCQFVPMLLNQEPGGTVNGFQSLPNTFVSGYPAARPFAGSFADPGYKFVFPVATQWMRPSDGLVQEANCSKTLRTRFERALEFKATYFNTQPQWLVVATWNDYVENAQLRPSAGLQYSFYDLTRYYIQWYKTRVKPVVVRDALFYFHRVQPALSSTTTSYPGSQPYVFLNSSPVDEIELVAFLKEAGDISIVTTAATRNAFAVAPSNISYNAQNPLRAPIADGKPRFLLKRNGQTVIDFSSAFSVSSSSKWQDLAYRGGSSLRPPVEGLLSAPLYQTLPNS